MSEITLALEHPSLGCGEIIARYDLSEIQDKAYQQGINDTVDKAIELLKEYPLVKAMGEILKLKEQNK